MSKTEATSDRQAAAIRERVEARLRDARRICAANPQAAFENVWHTLILLELPPLDRLNRGLIRGRGLSVRR